MARAALVAALLASAPILPEACRKADEKPVPSAPAVPLTSAPAVPLTSAPPPATSATTPPVWTPPELASAPPPAPPPPNADLAKARISAQAGDNKKVRALLEKKIKAGKGNKEEAMLLLGACAALRDKACVETVKTKHPDADAI